MNRRMLLAILPLIAFAGLAVALYVGLYLDPKEIPSALIDRPVPEFDLPPLPGRDKGLAARDLRAGQFVMVNVFASWCVPCRAEHPVLMELKRRTDVPLYGLNYKDYPAVANAWLKELGDPYERIGIDAKGRTGIELGVYGVPETFIIRGDGRIVCKHIGPLAPFELEEKILPVLHDLQTSGRTARAC